MHTLLSFLGKSRADSKHGYRTANYNFNGTLKETAYFGLALTETIRPDKLILIGTSGSMWDVFFQDIQNEEHVLVLMEAVENNATTAELLSPCIPQLSKHLGCDVECLIIDYATSEAEQINLLLKIAAKLEHGQHISMDVTHSFRHLPMLALVASRYLHTTKDILTDNIYYGALDMTDQNKKTTPVIELKGMLKMLEWTDALAAYDKDGDYFPFAELYRAEGQKNAADALEKAAFFEKTNQIGKARTPLKIFRDIDEITPINSLFIDELNQRTNWVDGENFAHRQISMAQNHLNKNNYLRSAVLAQEAFISHLVHISPRSYNDSQNYNHREDARKTFDEQRKKTPKAKRSELQNTYKILTNLRNSLAHGTPPKIAELQSVFSDEQKLQTLMQHCIDTIRQAIEKGQTE
ncbi:TIGR02221 family CRISPR-associated protein [Suttonella ornithocola]|uniref:CRISPR-associated protein, TM1812 family n=1 Tax=Suttonella ornithocola TaxID=279832 RepID=A0A380MZY1_9GAMM|nr:TIGR02221 family CRISPR-associated protein [Suttonella ornithocola]SUO97047.1 CRISPR-associated protein, TM1812 family [Suttonella ornithocola]